MPKADGRHDGSNLLLASLPRQSYARLEPKLREVTLKPKDMLHRAGEEQEWVYFPGKGGLVSLLALTQEGASVEVAITGREGMVGVSAALGAARVHQDSMVQNPGKAWRIT